MRAFSRENVFISFQFQCDGIGRIMTVEFNCVALPPMVVSSEQYSLQFLILPYVAENSIGPAVYVEPLPIADASLV